MRLFVAVDLDAAGRSALVAEQRRLQAGASGCSPVRWVMPEHLHLTLVFLGEVRDPQVSAIIGAYAEHASLAPFDMILRGIGVFPPRGSPRALWVGVGEGSAELTRLQHAMAERARALRLSIEDRAFSPHLTIGRWKHSRPSDGRRVLDLAGHDVLASVRVSRATLYQSQLGSHGPTYSPLAHATLAGPR